MRSSLYRVPLVLALFGVGVPALAHTPAERPSRPGPAQEASVQPARMEAPFKPLVDNTALWRRRQQERNKAEPRPLTDKERGPHQELSSETSSTATATALTVTIKGKLFYNDMRTEGQFTFRRNTSGAVGGPGSGMSGPANYLGALDVVADIYEVDTALCDGNDLLASATVGADGSYSATFTASEGCGSAGLDLAVRFRLRFCNSDSRCFRMTYGTVQDTYMAWHPDASEASPLTVSTSGTRDLGSAVFQTASTANDPADAHLQAMLYYASIVDTTRVWHMSNPIPFQYDTYGELKIKYPAVNDANASTTSPSQIIIQENTDSFTNGNVMFHEYGHVVHMRAWNGTTGTCGDCPGGDYMRDGNASWSAGELEYPNTAFAEGWANFARRATSGTDTCQMTGFDLNENSSPYPRGVLVPNDGKSYPGNVTKALCDWLDTTSDNDTLRAGMGDHFTADLYSVWYNLREMYDWAPDKSGLEVCDYIDYYLNGRKAVSVVGQTTHDGYVDSISDLAFNNGLQCGLATPSGK